MITEQEVGKAEKLYKKIHEEVFEGTFDNYESSDSIIYVLILKSLMSIDKKLDSLSVTRRPHKANTEPEEEVF